MLTTRFEDVKNFTNYVQTPVSKNKIVIHGTAGGSANGAIHWMNGGAGRNVAVDFVIGQNARIYRLFPEEYYAYHAGSKFRTISETSFGIEIVNWLYLTKSGSDYKTWVGSTIDPSRVKQVNMWRGHKYFHTITQQQHASLQYLLKYLCQKYDIRKRLYRNYDPNYGFNTSDFSGILFHSTFHPSKMDWYPSIIPLIYI